MSKVSEILKDTRGFVNAKQAEFKQGLAGEDPNSLPGAEHDKPVESGMKAPHKEVKEELPPNGTSAAGASDADNVEMGHTHDATQPAGGPHSSVKKEPAVTADAMAGSSTNSVSDNQAMGKASDDQSTASLGNDLLAAIKRAQVTPEGEGEPAPAEGDDKQAAAPEGEPAAEGEPTPKEASPENQLELTNDVLAKIASTLLSTEEGWAQVEDGLAKAAGAEAARETMGYLTQQAEQAEKAAQYDQGYTDAEGLIQNAIYMQGVEDEQKRAGAGEQPPTPEEAEILKQAGDYASGYTTANALIEKLAAEVDKQRGAPKQQAPAPVKEAGNDDIVAQLGRQLAEESIKAAMPEDMDYAAEAEGADPMAAAGDPMAAMMGGGDELGGEEAAGALEEMGGAPGDEDVSPEELEMALAALVEEGSIDPETAQAIIEHISSSDAVAGAAEGDPMAEAGGMDYGEGEAEPAAGMEAMASAPDLLAAIRRVQQQPAATA